MSATMTELRPGCLARAGAIPCRGCGACDGSVGDGVADVTAGERARIAGEHFRSLRGASGVDAAVTVCARERIVHDHAKASRRRQHVIGSDAAVAALKCEWALNRVNADGVALQDEFGDEEDFIAFSEHDRAGHVTILERKAARPDGGLSMVLSATALRRVWDANLAVQAEFGDFETYSAFRRAEARGAVRIVRDSPGVIKG